MAEVQFKRLEASLMLTAFCIIMAAGSPSVSRMFGRPCVELF